LADLLSQFCATWFASDRDSSIFTPALEPCCRLVNLGSFTSTFDSFKYYKLTAHFSANWMDLYSKLAF
jgi:hypothetical protein